jgi:undecaprenyl-diphosphatase
MDSISTFFQAIESLGALGYWIIFLASFLESVAIVGAFVPGSIIVVSVGFVASEGYLDLGTLIWVVSIGAILGDTVSYWLGTKGKRFFKNENRILKASHLDMGKDFFARHGNKSIFIGRFVGVIRPVVAFSAGISRMHFGAFMAWNIASSFVWAAAYLMLGYFFAGAFATIELWTGRVSAIFLAIALLAWGVWQMFRKRTVN